MAPLRPLDPCAPPDLRHLRRLTDDFGIFQHTKEEQPLLDFGYAIDDVARALIVVVETARLFPAAPAAGTMPEETGTLGHPDGSRSDPPGTRTLGELADFYLRFVEFCQLPDGRFHNFVAHDRTFRDVEGSLDSYGRTVWSLGVASRLGATAELKDRSKAVLRAALPHVHDIPAVRSKAFTLLGLLSALSAGDPFGVQRHALRLTDDLLHAYADAATDDWPWFEDTLRYSNGAFPYALLRAAGSTEFRKLNDNLAQRARAVGLRTLDFLLQVCAVDGMPMPIGNQDWYRKGGERARFDQQGVDAAAMVVACAQAWSVTHEPRYLSAAELWWSWFFGNNSRRQSLYRSEDGAVYDGLMEHGVNRNRGAESVIAFLLAHVVLAEASCEKRTA